MSRKIIIPFLICLFSLLFQTYMVSQQEGDTDISLAILSTPPAVLEFPAESEYNLKIAIRNTGNFSARIPFIRIREKNFHTEIRVLEPVMIDKSSDGLYIMPGTVAPGEEKQYTLNILPGSIGEEILTLQAGCQNMSGQPVDMTVKFSISYAAKDKPGGWSFGGIAGLLIVAALVVFTGYIIIKRRRKKTAPQPRKEEEKTKKKEHKIPAKLVLSSNKLEIESNGKDKAQLIARVLDQNDAPVVGQVVEFAVIDRGTITTSGKFTGKRGTVKARFLPETGSQGESRVGALCPDYPDILDSIVIKVVSAGKEDQPS